MPCSAVTEAQAGAMKVLDSTQLCAALSSEQLSVFIGGCGASGVHMCLKCMFHVRKKKKKKE